MLQLGTWATYTTEAEPSLFEWYRLPDAQRAELLGYRPDGNELAPMPPERFAAVRKAAIDYAVQSVAGYNNPYHDLRHFAATEASGMAIVKAYEALTGTTVQLAVKQALSVGLLLHDCHHCGDTFRADTRKPLYRPELGTRVSLEWVSALAANDFCRRHGFAPPARIFQTLLIWASTYGGDTARGKELGIPVVRPQSFWGCLMRAADIAPFEDNLEEFLRRSIAVHFGCTNANPRPKTWEGLINSQLGFIAHLRETYAKLDHTAGVLVTKALGWQGYLESLEEQLQQLRNRKSNSVAVRFTVSELAKYGFVLP